MPIYAYRCERCGEALEVLLRSGEAPPERCPGCGAAALVRQLSAPAFRLAGGGWYETDFKTGDKRNLAGETPPCAGGEGPACGAPGCAAAE
ncbi:MAG: hypothetical protein KatS3mg124_0426 [Porticoccaceae bacterium]|nr:MAG: hypothetical protein KatS3mg124_0426 [Porticoccaceae bacterium]